MLDRFHIEKGRKGKHLADEKQVKVKVCDCVFSDTWLLQTFLASGKT